MELNEIKGSVEINSLGKIRVTMRTCIEGTGLSTMKQPITWEIEATPDFYYISLKDMETKVKVSDVVEARVEAATILRENYDITENTIELIKELIGEAWLPPRLVKDKVEQLVAEHEENEW